MSLIGVGAITSMVSLLQIEGYPAVYPILDFLSREIIQEAFPPARVDSIRSLWIWSFVTSY